MTRTSWTLRPLTGSDAVSIARWHYPEPWSRYDVSDPLARSADLGYQAVVDGRAGRLVGFVCLGGEARVAGMREEPGVVDIGFGLDPAIAGRGQGHRIFTSVLARLEETIGPVALRAVVQSWNARSLRLCARLGFFETGHFVVGQNGTEVDYIVLQRDSGAVTPSSDAQGAPRDGHEAPTAPP